MIVNDLIGRKRHLFANDIAAHENRICDALAGARVLVYGGAGSIGREVVLQIFRRNPAALHVMDISENNLVELVRDLRSSFGHTKGETLFLPLDFGSLEATAFIHSQAPYDYVLNIAAMKHVRSEKDAFSLMRMIKTNILDTRATLLSASARGAKKYFAVSTDKAKNPANLMGATKRIMEDVLFGESETRKTEVSTARFANVAFSDGSLLHGFRQRLIARQPISAPRDIRRYFVTGAEAGELCLASLLLAKHREILFPKLDAGLSLLTFAEIAIRFLHANGYDCVEVGSEEEARARTADLIGQGKWPCYFFDSDTPGEKPFEEFYSDDDSVAFDRFEDIGVISMPSLGFTERRRYEEFLHQIASLRERGNWSKADLVSLVQNACPELSHVIGQRSLDEKM